MDYYILPTNRTVIHSNIHIDPYVISPTDSDIQHAGGHKYIDKVQTKSGKWRYIYNMAQKKTARGLQKAKYAIRNEKAAQENLRIEKNRARVRNTIANKYEDQATRDKIESENQRRIKGAKDRTALGKLKKNAPDAIKRTINKGLDWLERNKIFSTYTVSTTKVNGKIVDHTKKKNRFKGGKECRQ